MRTLDRSRLEHLLRDEEKKFHAEHPKSHELYQRALQSMQGGVPMLWMIRWAGTFPVFVKDANGAHFTDIDGRTYIDFCLGDTGAMTGHSPDATLAAIHAQAAKANELCNRFTLDVISTSATIAFAMECFEHGLITTEQTGGMTCALAMPGQWFRWLSA